MKKGQSYLIIILLGIIAIALIVIAIKLFTPSLNGKVITGDLNNKQQKEGNIQQQPVSTPVISPESKPINLYENYETIEGQDIITVCENPCPINKDLLIAKHNGMENAIEKLRSFIGELPNKPIYVHLNGDSDCGTAEDMNKSHGYISGFIREGKDGNLMICTFDYEIESKRFPFNQENAIKIENQLLFIHEMVHGYFKNTSVSYKIQEDFSKAISFHISGNCIWNSSEEKYDPVPVTTACKYKWNDFNINRDLCDNFGFDFKDYNFLFSKIKENVDNSITVDDNKVIQIISDYVGRDVSLAFGSN